jgi:hypothetical protein
MGLTTTLTTIGEYSQFAVMVCLANGGRVQQGGHTANAALKGRLSAGSDP